MLHQRLPNLPSLLLNRRFIPPSHPTAKVWKRSEVLFGKHRLSLALSHPAQGSRRGAQAKYNKSVAWITAETRFVRRRSFSDIDLVR